MTRSTPEAHVPQDVLELAEIMRDAWPVIDEALQASGVPLCEGDPAPATPPEPTPPPDPQPTPPTPPTPDPDPENVDEDTLPDAVKAILKKERDARRDAERKLRDASKPKPPDPKPDDPKPGDPKPDPVQTVTDKLRRANLKAALAEEGITGQQAKATTRLLDDVEFDDDDEPVNLADAIAAAEEAYGKAVVRGTAKPKPPNTDAAAGAQPATPPKLNAEELAMAEQFGMSAEEYVAFKDPNVKPPAKKDTKDQ